MEVRDRLGLVIMTTRTMTITKSRTYSLAERSPAWPCRTRTSRALLTYSAKYCKEPESESALYVLDAGGAHNVFRDVARPGGDDPRAPSSRFTGTARTLGGDDTPSQVIEDPTARMPQRQPRVERQLHFWADGFSVDDGPLYRSDDPANAGYLSMIREGHAPLAIMNVTRNQEVDVKLVQHEEKYVAPKKKYKPFSGSGQRLGSPTPGAGGSTYSDAAAAPASAQAPELAGGALSTVGVNESQPTITLQIRLGDGTRLSSRFNTTHTIGDVYDFVYASNTASRGRLWVLMTTFPSRELSDKEIALGDLAEFKRGGVVVQKWT